MFKRMKKAIVAVTVAGLLFTAFAPLGMVGQAEASSKNYVDRVVNISDDATTLDGTEAQIPTLTIKNDDSDWVANTTGETFRVKVPAGCEIWPDKATGTTNATVPAVAKIVGAGGAVVKDALTKKISKTELEVVVTTTAGTDTETVKVPLWVKIDGPTGDVKVTVDARESVMTSGTYTFAVVSGGDATVTVSDNKTVSERTIDFDKKGIEIQIDENVGDTLTSDSAVKFKLPANFAWDGTAATLSDGTNIVANYKSGDGDRTLELKLNAKADLNSSRTTFFLKGAVVLADRDAAKGDVNITVSGDDFTTQDVTAFTYADYNANVTVETVKTLVAGQIDQEPDTITVEETVPGTFLVGREISIILPDGVKIQDDSEVDGSTFDAKTGVLGDNQNEYFITINKENTGSDGESIDLDLNLSIAADFTGDVNMEISGAGIEKQDLVIAKVVAPIEISAAAGVDLRIGLTNQAAPNIVITETQAETIDPSTDAIDDSILVDADRFGSDSADNTGNDTELKLVFDNDNIQWSADPTVKVIEGDLEIDSNNIDTDGAVLTIPIQGGSAKTSKIEISNIKIDVDRTVAEGAFALKVGGGAIVKNYEEDADNQETPQLFSTEWVKKFDYAKIITPAPGEMKATSMFTIDSTTYKVIENGVTVEKTTDVAPYIMNGRTMLPLRAVATAIGVSDDMITWNAYSHTALVNKNGKLASVTVGSKVLDVNGMKILMDTPAVIKNSRMFLPVSFLATALGVTATWDAATKTVTFAE